MADPQHMPETNLQDRITVILYRAGIVMMAVMSTLFIIDYFTHSDVLSKSYLPLFATGAALASANVHLYDPRFRYLLPLMSWIGFVLLAFTLTLSPLEVKAQHLLLSASLGFFYAGAAMFAIKEQFCFKIPGLQLMPVFLVVSVFARYFHWELVETIALIPAAFLMLWLSIAKWRMPLHFDIGDKDKYTV